jgi:hypothetical protein
MNFYTLDPGPLTLFYSLLALAFFPQTTPRGPAWRQASDLYALFFCLCSLLPVSDSCLPTPDF